MIFFLILTAAWVIMMIVPFTVVGFMSKRNRAEERPLNVRNDNVRNPRYFSKSFVAMIDKALKEREGDKIKLSKEEKIIDGDMIRGKKGGLSGNSGRKTIYRRGVYIL